MNKDVEKRKYLIVMKKRKGEFNQANPSVVQTTTMGMDLDVV